MTYAGKHRRAVDRHVDVRLDATVSLERLQGLLIEALKAALVEAIAALFASLIAGRRRT